MVNFQECKYYCVRDELTIIVSTILVTVVLSQLFIQLYVFASSRVGTEIHVVGTKLNLRITHLSVYTIFNESIRADMRKLCTLSDCFTIICGYIYIFWC